MPRYRITAGSFVDHDPTAADGSGQRTHGPGDTIELGEDVARMHADKLVRLADDDQAAEATQAPTA